MADNNLSETRGQERKPNHKVLTGTVTSSKMQKTIVVEVTRKKAHPLYKRVISIRKKFYAHDEKNEAHVGDVVAHRGIAPAVPAEALDAEGNCAQDGTGAGNPRRC